MALNDRTAAGESMSEYWDRRAGEDAYFFVDNRMRYRDPDLTRFWSGGREALDGVLGPLGVEIKPSDEIVEVGCGIGRITRVLAERGASVRALDVSPQMLERARELNAGVDNIEWILGDGYSLTGIADDSADVCHSHVVFQHIPDPQITLRYVREMGRVLRPGGWAGFHVSNDPTVHRRRGRLGRILQWGSSILGRAPREQSGSAWLGSAVDMDDLERAAREAGLDTERVVGAGTQWCLVLLRKAIGGTREAAG